MADHHELVVIGAGTAGFAAAEEARAAGRDVLLVSGNDELGGTCILRGCMPAKTLLAAAQVEGVVAKAHEVGVETAPVHVDLPAIIRRKRALVDYFAEDRRHELHTYPLQNGDARFIDERTILAGGRRITAERFIIATGARVDRSHVVAPPGARVLTSTDVLESTRIPASMTVAGGGPIGCSFAQFFARLGARVTLFQDGPELLRNEDPDVGAAVRAALMRDGVDVVLDADLRVHPAQRPAEMLLVATHRLPWVEALDPAAAGVAADGARGVRVDATLRSVSNPRVYAAGDAIGRRSMVHTAAYGGRLAARNAFAAEPEPADWRRWEVHSLYTAPQVAVIGLDERAARDAGMAVDVATLPASEVGKALVADEAEGFIKMLVERESRCVAGVVLALDDAIDLAGEAIALIDRRATARAVAEMPHLHPTMSELYARVAERLC